MTKKKYQFKGQSLIEVIIALAVVLLVVIALLRVVVTAVKSSDFAKKRVLASSFAQEGMENMRSLRDKSWINFLSYADGINHGLAGQVPSGSCPTTPNLADAFIRCVKLEYDGVKVKATLTVAWATENETHESELISYFTNWQ